MDQDSAHMVAASKVPMLKPGEYEIWRMRIEQYIQMIDYALWEVIENAKADIAMKLITFTLSHFDKPLSFNLDVFSIVIGIERSKDFVSIPPKETVKVDLVTLGLTDGNDTSLSSSDLINSSLGSHDQQMPLHPVTDKKERKSNISYTRYLSLIMEHMLGEAYINENLKTLKPHHITALSFKPILENETALTSHGCKVAKLSPDPIKSLLPPSGEVNADDSADKSSFETSMQLVIQPKAPTNLKTKKKQIPPASKPKSSKQVKDLPPKKQVDETQPIVETVATADATQNLGASESTEDQENQPRTADAEKVTVLNIRGTARNHSQTSLGESGDDTERLEIPDVLDQKDKETVQESGFIAIEDVTFKQIMDEFDSKTQGAQENAESPYDIESEIKIIKSYQAATIFGSLFIHQSSSYNHDDQDVIDITPTDAKEGDASKSLSGLRSMPDDDLASTTGFETQDSADHVFEEGTETLHASTDKLTQSDPLGHLHEELYLLHNKLPGLLSDALKDTLPQLIKDSIKCSVLESIVEELPQVEAQ
ncbi:hypothetical protein Tco_1169465, partial [Tanacetum coccineum]